MLGALGIWMSLRLEPEPAFLEQRSPLPKRDAPRPTGTELREGAEVLRNAVAGDVCHYTLLLTEGQFLSLEAEQQGVDVSLRLLAPGGGLVAVIDSPNGERGTERLQLLASESGLYVLEVVVADGPPGTYRLRVNSLRPASPINRRLAAAASAYFDAESLRRGGRGSQTAALAAYRHALTLAKRGKDLRWQALTLHRIGQVSEGLNRFDEALESYQASLDLYGRCGDSWEQALLFHTIGRLYRRSGEYRSAMQAYSSSLVQFAELRDASRQGSALNDLGLIHARLGAMQEAIDCYQGALAIWRRIEKPDFEATTLKNLGDVYASLRYNERAARFFRQALAQFRAAGDEAAEALVLESFGTIQRRQGSYPEAFASFARALALTRRYGDRRVEAIVLNSQGATCFKLGDFTRARALYQGALHLAEEIEEPGIGAYAQVNLGWLEEIQGRPESAFRHHSAAVTIFRELGDLEGETSALFGLARAERQQGHLAAARSLAQAALTRIELLRNRVDNEETRSAFLADRHGYYEFLIDLLMEMNEQQPEKDLAATAFQVSERSRARSLLDMLRSNRVDLAQGVAADLLAREREVSAELQSAELKRLRWLAGGRGRAADFDATLTLLTEELHDLRGRIRAQNPSYAVLIQAEVPTLGEVQAQLDEDTLLLEFSLGEERSFLWLVGRASQVHRILPGRQEIEAQATRVRRLFQQSHVPLYRRQMELVLQDLSRTLLAPVAGQLRGKRLVIVADGVLQLIPFAALPLPAPAAHAYVPLITRYEVVQLPSITVLQVLRQRETTRPPAPKTLALFGDPVFRNDDPRVPPRRGRQAAEDATESGFSPSWFSSLPSSRRESQAILALVPAQQRFGALGFDASLDRLLSLDLRTFRILHFASHGILNHEHPDLSGIALSQVKADGTPREAILWAYQVYGLDLPVELVVLSACQTAVGKEVRGEGVIGLTRGFMHAGATRVVVSLWNVSDVATAELMTRFYQALLREGVPPAAALRKAQLSLLTDMRWSSPYYWAGFVLQGDWL